MPRKAQDFLLEIGTEPLPARFVRPALEQLAAKLSEKLRESRLGFGGVKTWGTLRRLTIMVEKLDEASEKTATKVYGPPSSKWKEPSGEYSVTATGFARKYGLEPAHLTVEVTAKGEQLVAKQSIPSEKATEILERALPELVWSLEFPKSMEWEDSRKRFGRPIRSLLALYGSKALSMSIAGIKSGNKLSGLFVLGRKPAPLAEPSKYVSALRTQLVLVDPAERREALLKRLELSARSAGGRLEQDEALLDETVFMTEQPTPVVGRFRKEFLVLPAPLLSLVMTKQLKFFPLHGKEGLLDSFIGVRDGISEGQELVRQGYQRVIEARLNDAKFFLGRDLSSPLEAKLPGLARVAYQKGLGTMADKAKRVAQLAEWFCELLRQDKPVSEPAVAQIAKLCYADLVSEVVKEFPELQGLMGGFYARKEGADERVASGLEQFYSPAGPKSAVPAFAEGALVSLAGKLDSLAGSFAVGVVPTGSADPFALRRQALGALRILLEKLLPIDLGRALQKALSLQPVALDEAKRAELSRALEDFVWARAQPFFEEKGFAADEIRAVRPGALRNLPQTYLRLAALKSVRKNPDFEPLAAAFKRASNILKQAKVAADGGTVPERTLLKEEAELALYDNLVSLESRVRERLLENDFEVGLKTLVAIKPHLDLFFERVMVMAEDPSLRVQRLSLLAKLVRLFNAVADLSELQGTSQN